MTLKNEIESLKLSLKSIFLDFFHKVKRVFKQENLEVTQGDVEFNGKLCIFCSFALSGIKSSTWNYLHDLKQNGFSIHLVSTAPLSECDLVRLKELCYKITQKENFGTDFSCFKISILEHYKIAESILLANDSVIGPLFALREVFEEMENVKCDFWGMTDYIPFNEKKIHHIASFFIFFKQNVIKDRSFLDFWKNFKPSSSRKKNVYFGEFKINEVLVKAGFKFESYVNSSKMLDLIEKLGVNELFDDLLLEIHQSRLKPFKKGILDISNKEDLKTFILMQNKHKQNLMLIKYFRYPFIKKDILQKNFIKHNFLIDFLDNNNFNISRYDILNELKKK
jgi:hypothetical protein